MEQLYIHSFTFNPRESIPYPVYLLRRYMAPCYSCKHMSWGDVLHLVLSGWAGECYQTEASSELLSLLPEACRAIALQDVEAYSSVRMRLVALAPQLVEQGVSYADALMRNSYRELLGAVAAALAEHAAYGPHILLASNELERIYAELIISLANLHVQQHELPDGASAYVSKGLSLEPLLPLLRSSLKDYLQEQPKPERKILLSSSLDELKGVSDLSSLCEVELVLVLSPETAFLELFEQLTQLQQHRVRVSALLIRVSEQSTQEQLAKMQQGLWCARFLLAAMRPAIYILPNVPDLQRFTSYVLKNQFQYQCIRTSEGAIVYRELLNGGLVREYELDEQEVFLLSYSRRSRCSIDELLHAYRQLVGAPIVDLALMNALDGLRDAGLVYASPRYEDVMSMIEIPEC
ncbi:hypothetical protein [Porphyromonas sp.]